MSLMILVRVVWKIVEHLDYVKKELFEKEKFAKG